jgi:FtsH-binding integral membrane protein
MSHTEAQTFVSRAPLAVDAKEEERVAFIQRTYLHLGLAILAFVAVEYALLKSYISIVILNLAFGGRINWLIFLGLFMLVGGVANRWAQSDASPRMQYLGLGLYILAEAVIFVPLMFVAASYSTEAVIPSAAIMTLTVFGGLSAIVFILKKDFSFLRMGLTVAGMLALGLIAAAILIGFDLGVLFSVAMIGLAAGYVLYYTSNVLNHYRTDQHVAASLALFATIALMFWYILRLLLQLRRK